MCDYKDDCKIYNPVGNNDPACTKAMDRPYCHPEDVKAPKPGCGSTVDSLTRYIEFKEGGLAGSVVCGLRTEWMSGENDEERLSLFTGSGLGTPFMLVEIEDKKEGETRYFQANLSNFLPEFADALNTPADKPSPHERLYDMLLDMIQGDRLTEADIPDDYQALLSAMAIGDRS